MENSLSPRVIEKLREKENLGSTQKYSANLVITPNLDEAVDYIAKYLFEHINKDFFSYIEENPGLRSSLGEIAVRSYRTYDAYQVSTPEYPLLKVYRVSDNWKPQKLLRTSSISISYSLSLPQQERLMSLLNWISYEIRKHLLSPSFKVKILEDGVRTQYRTMINEVGQAIHSFLRVDITIID